MKFSEREIIATVKMNQKIEGINISTHTELMARNLIKGLKTEKQLLEEIRENHRNRVSRKVKVNV
jgi:hypothetical protein